jgi:hypothetical protein
MKEFIALTWVFLTAVIEPLPFELSVLHRLTKDPAARPIPRDMLDHPWLSKASKRKVDMEQWIGEVWNWDDSARDS